MMERAAESSGRPRARATGAVYLLYFLTAILGEFLISRKLVVYGDVVSLAGDACYITLTLLFYYMFEPVNKGLSLLAASFSLLGCGLTVLGLFHLAPTHVSPLLFFGPYCLLLGYLIFRSTFLPRILGVLMMIAGLGWLIFLYESLGHSLSLYIEGLGILAEALLMLWLLVMGVNVPRWKEQGDAGKTADV
jgi:hypothetical protein